MLTSASPSPTSSPGHPFGRSYHAAAYRHRSPRLSRRLDVDSPLSAPSERFSPQLSQQPTPQQHPSHHHHCCPPRRATADAGTQYSPPGYPPTHKPKTAVVATPPTVAVPPPQPQPPPPPPPPPPAKRISPQSIARREPSAEDVATAQPRKPDPRVTPKDSLPEVQQHAAHTVGSSSSDTGASQRSRSVEEDTDPDRTSKRARPADPEVKLMPLRYETCDSKDLGVLISDMLMELVRLNDKIPLGDRQLTRFHSRAPPGISVRDYLQRLIIHATLSPPILLSMVYYVDRLCALYPAFTISSLTVHRFLITAATVAAKGLSDSFWTNSTYARVGGLSTRELALLELEFLRRVEWRIVPRPEILSDYYRGLVERGAGFEIEGEHPVPSNSEDGMDTDSGQSGPA